MHILHLDPRGRVDFALPGHTVTKIDLPGYDTPLNSILAGLDRPPDLVIHQETLGGRRFLSGLENAPCPTLYLACDTHLNLFWQQHYARLFDAALTPHPSLFAALPPDRKHPQVIPFAHAGMDLPWRNHADRSRKLAFCGTMSAERPIRAWMVSLLRERFGLEALQNVFGPDMPELYLDTRIAPNEAICFEMNFRLLESASAGAAVLTPDCGPEQTDVFADGPEILVYRDGLDLMEKTAWLINNPGPAERMGKAAWERVRREHLPRHRAAALFELLPRIRRCRATGGEAAVFSWLTLLERAFAGDSAYPVSFFLARGADLPQTPETLAGVARLLGTPGKREAALDSCRSVLAAGPSTDSALCDSAYSALALMHGDFDLARTFFARNALSGRETARRRALPETPLALCLAWSGIEKQLGRAVRPGFSYNPAKGHIPACAHEFLIFGEYLAGSAAPGSPGGPAARETAALLAPYPAYAAHRMALLEKLAAHNGNWRDMLACGLAAVFCCRVDEGLRAVAAAGAAAENRGESRAFVRALAGCPSHAYITAALEKMDRQ